MQIYCCCCRENVAARDVTGKILYPHRPDLYEKNFFQCPKCGNYTGTHATGKPLGSIPTPELSKARMKVHAAIDPLWKDGKMKRGKLYAMIAENFGLPEYHTAEIREIAFAEEVIKYVQSIIQENGK